MNFEKTNDPLESMRIGSNRTNFDSEEKLIEIIILKLPSILKTKKIPEDILGDPGLGIKSIYFKKIREFISKKTVNGVEVFIWPWPIVDKLKKMGFKK